MTPQCPRESEVIGAMLANRWPHQCDEALCAHAMHCEICKDLVDLVGLMREDRERLADISVPAAGQVWWRSAIRARLEASQQVARPLSWLLGVAAACVVGLGMAGVELLWSPIQRALVWGQQGSWMPSISSFDVFTLPRLADLAPWAQVGALIFLGAAACLLVAPVALYFALSDE